MVAPSRTVSTPVITDSPHRHVLYQHFSVSEADLPQTIGRAFSALYGRVAEAGVIPAGPPFSVYYDESEPGVSWELDVCVPVSAPVTATPDIHYREMPATEVVSLLHIGPYNTLGEAYAAIDSYIRDKGLNAAGPTREFYMTPGDVPSGQVQTLVERPVI